MEIRILGRIAVLHGGVEAGLGAKKQRRVLASLLAAPDLTRTIEQLMDDLWSDESPRQPRASLYAYISRLRRALAGPDDREIIKAVGGGYHLDIEPEELDATLFESELLAARSEVDDDRAIALVKHALARWSGEPFADAAGEPFIARTTAHLWAIRRAGEEHLVELLTRAGDHNQCVVVAQEIAAREPFDEAAQALVMMTLYRAGRQAEALRHFSSTRQLLVEQLGVEPGVELRTLERQILDQERSLSGNSPMEDPPLQPIRARRAIVGRDAELAVIDGAIESDQGHSPVVLIEGDAGIGKTRLLHEVARRAKARDRRVIWVSGERGPRGAALLPVAAAVADLADTMTDEQLDAAVGRDHEALAPLLASGGFSPDHGEPLDVGDDMARYRTTEAVRRYLRRLAATAPVLVVVDDAQWASPALLELLIGLTTRRGPTAVAFAIAARRQRPDEVTLALSTLRRSVGAETVALGGLDEEAVRQLIVGELGQEAATFANEIHGRTRGNPFFVSELLRLIDPAHPTRLPTPSTLVSVTEAVSTHLTELSAEAVDLSAVASLMDTPFDPILCAQIAGHSDRASDIVDRMLKAGLVVEESASTRLSFKHDLVRTSIQTGLSSVRKSELHARIGLALVDRQGSLHPADPLGDDTDAPYVAAVVASHLCSGAAFGTGPLGARYAIEAARQSLRRHDAHEARRLATEGLNALDQPSASGETPPEDIAMLRAELLCELADALKRSFDHPEAHDAVRRAFEIAMSSGLFDLATRALRAFSGQSGDNWLGSWSYPGETIAMVDVLLDRAGGLSSLPATTAVSVLGPYSEAVLDRGDVARADELTATAVTLADQTDDPALIAFAAERRLAFVDMTPTTVERSLLCSRILDVYPQHPRYGPLACRHLMVSAVESGDLAAAERHVQAIDALTRDRDSELLAIEAAVCRTSLDFVMGRLGPAATEIASAWERFGHLDESRLDVFNVLQFWLGREAGDLAATEGPIREKLVQNDTPSWKAPLLLVLVSGDRLEEAQELADSMAPVEYQRVFESSLQLFTPAVLADTVAALGDKEKAAFLLPLLEPMSHRMISFYTGTLLLGWASLPVGRLLGVVGRFDEAEKHLKQSLRRAERLGSPSLRLQSRVAMAELDGRQGRDVGERVISLAEEAASSHLGGIAQWCRRLAR